MSSTLFNDLKNNTQQYDEEQIKVSLVIIRCSKNEKLVEKHKLIVYNALSCIIIKNVNNFFNLIKNVEEYRVFHTKDDVVVECYRILHRCFGNFDPKKKKGFFFYYNKSLSFGLYRLAHTQYKTDLTFKDYEVSKQFEEKTFVNNIHDPLFINVNLTPEQQDYIDSKLNDEKINDFIARKGLTKTNYYKLASDVKKILAHIYEKRIN